MKPTIYIPYSGEPDECIDRAVRSAVTTGLSVEVIDNTEKQSYLLNPKSVPTAITVPSAPLTLSQTIWYLCQGGQPFFWMHADGEIIDKSVAERLLELTVGRWGVLFTYYDVFCLVNAPSLVSSNILPDIYLPQYHFDPDWYRRMRLGNFNTVATDYGHMVLHHNGGGNSWKGSLARDKFRQCMDTERYYREKWGGDIGAETYDIPWNQG